MKISWRFNESWLFRFSKKLFIDTDTKMFDKSVFLKVLKFLTNQPLSVCFLILSVILLLYKSLLGGTMINNYNIWFLLLVLAAITCDKRAIKSNRSILFLFGFIIWGLISAIVAALCGVVTTILIYGAFLSTIFPLYFIVGGSYPKRYYRLLPVVLILICLPLLLAGVWQLVTGVTTPEYWVSPVENLIKLRAYGFSENPNNLGAVAMMSGLVATFAFWVTKKWYWAIYALLALFVTVMTFSRTSWIGWLIAIFTVLIIKNWRYILLSVFALLGLLVPSVRQRIFSTSSPKFIRDSSLDGRIWTAKGIFDIFKSSPVFGAGPGTYGNSMARDYISPAYNLLPQNGYVASYMVDMQWQQILCQYGIVGVVLVAGFGISYVVNMYIKYKASKNLVCLASIGIMLTMLVTGFLENVWFFAPLAALYGIVLGAGQGYLQNE